MNSLLDFQSNNGNQLTESTFIQLISSNILSVFTVRIYQSGVCFIDDVNTLSILFINGSA
ncbi:hypothetical protein GW796_00450 [archaeon]|nr:hypothetical protein [archaeon]